MICWGRLRVISAPNVDIVERFRINYKTDLRLHFMLTARACLESFLPHVQKGHSFSSLLESVSLL